MNVRLLVNGRDFTGWKSINVQKSLMQLAGTFEFVSSNKYPQESVNWKIQLGDECEIRVDDETMITGYIESIPESYDASSYELAFTGRDKTGDLTDCSHITPNEYLNLTIKEIIENLISPFDIKLIFNNSFSVIPNALATELEEFRVEQGATILDAISSLCMSIGLFPVSFGDGNLAIVMAGETLSQQSTLAVNPLDQNAAFSLQSTASIRGDTQTFDAIDSQINVLSGRRNLSNEDRFSQYIVKVQEEVIITGLKTNPLVGISEDDTITRHRPLIIHGDAEKTIQACQDRAEWEKRIRAGMSRAITYTMQGWKQSNGQLWPLNAFTNVNDLNFSILEQKLISNISYNLSEQGGSTVTILAVDPGTFQPRRVPLQTNIG